MKKAVNSWNRTNWNKNANENKEKGDKKITNE